MSQWLYKGKNNTLCPSRSPAAHGIVPRKLSVPSTHLLNWCIFAFRFRGDNNSSSQTICKLLSVKGFSEMTFHNGLGITPLSPSIFISSTITNQAPATHESWARLLGSTVERGCQKMKVPRNCRKASWIIHTSSLKPTGSYMTLKHCYSDMLGIKVLLAQKSCQFPATYHATVTANHSWWWQWVYHPGSLFSSNTPPFLTNTSPSINIH